MARKCVLADTGMATAEAGSCCWRAARKGSYERKAKKDVGSLCVCLCVCACVCVRVPGQLVAALPRSRASQDYLCFDCLSLSRSLASKSENHPDG